MHFIPDSQSIAAKKMEGINPKLVDKFTKLMLFLSENTDRVPSTATSKKLVRGSEEHIERLATSFNNGRIGKAPTAPSTIPDKMVSNILNIYFDVNTEDLELAKDYHMLSMGAENIIGNLLERYIASVMEPQGWIWCSGNTVRAVDFIKPPVDENDSWSALQVKNRSNTENSSSVAIRNGTEIQKWHRTFSNKAVTNWEEFPCINAKDNLSEEGFKEFVDAYLLSKKESHKAVK